MITDTDRKVIRHFEQYKYATIEQIRRIFFPWQKNGYNIARRRLGAIRNEGYIKDEKHTATNRLVYMLNEPKIKLPDTHRLILLDVLANIYYCGYNVQKFDIEKQWMDGKIRSDAFTVFTLETEGVKNRYQYFIEIHLSHNPHNLEKYDRLLETTEVQEYLGRNVNPRVLLITDRRPDVTLKHTQVVTLGTDLKAFSSVILPERDSTPALSRSYRL